MLSSLRIVHNNPAYPRIFTFSPGALSTSDNFSQLEQQLNVNGYLVQSEDAAFIEPDIQYARGVNQFAKLVGLFAVIAILVSNIWFRQIRSFDDALWYISRSKISQMVMEPILAKKSVPMAVGGNTFLERRPGWRIWHDPDYENLWMMTKYSNSNLREMRLEIISARFMKADSPSTALDAESVVRWYRTDSGGPRRKNPANPAEILDDKKEIDHYYGKARLKKLDPIGPEHQKWEHFILMGDYDATGEYYVHFDPEGILVASGGVWNSYYWQSYGWKESKQFEDFLTTVTPLSGRPIKMVTNKNEMAPLILNGDEIIVSDRAYEENDPARGEIVLVHYPNSKFCCVWRIVGLPGEKLCIKNGKVFINGAALESNDFPKDRQYASNPANPFGKEGQITLIPKDSYFVISDQHQMWDSRKWGPFRKREIIARAQRVYKRNGSVVNIKL